jgi:hypothetical protein
MYFTTSILSYLFNIANQVAKSIGLFYSAEGIGRANEAAGASLSYCLIELDLALCWATGWSTSTPSHYNPLQSSTPPSKNAFTTYLDAKAAMTEFEIHIHTHIYSEFRAKDEDQIRNFIARSREQLETWWQNSGLQFENQSRLDSFETCSQVELAIILHSIRILLSWPGREDRDIGSQILHNARTYLRELLLLWRATSELGHYSILIR